MITAKEAHECSLKNNEYYKEHLIKIDELIKTASSNGYFKVKYKCNINDSVLTGLIEILKDFGYRMSYTPSHDNYSLHISW